MRKKECPVLPCRGADKNTSEVSKKIRSCQKDTALFGNQIYICLMLQFCFAFNLLASLGLILCGIHMLGAEMEKIK
jgi:hypothetical protein